MEIIDELSQKVELAARQIIDLKKDRHQLQSEVDLLRKQLRDYQSTLTENEKFKRDQETLRSKLLRLQKKIEKHLLVEMTLASPMNLSSRSTPAENGPTGGNLL